MRKDAFLREPLERDRHDRTVKIMLYKAEDNVYLFEYSSQEAALCFRDSLYDSLQDLHDEWDDLVDERGWIDMEDPLLFCQHDAFVPIRVRGREAGRPEWGRFETLKDGKWVEYLPE